MKKPVATIHSITVNERAVGAVVAVRSLAAGDADSVDSDMKAGRLGGEPTF
ncbi:hypothetical protein PTKU64_05540 [Paraburkholderia terrae]|uniref:Uncharacterized protein n=1 Tax=Paraburkholderia terrae TaxID=311230 RepID=A0ABM7TFD8_9BURK|nr:hypothetical protein PTKU64_05540 [Paraburkholderia terrae]BDC37263.1 hypothetical protein PTKU15_05600 [Paraburkholderia terrae]